MFCNIVKIWRWGVLSIRPHPPKLQVHPLSVIRNCLFNIFTATVHIWRSNLYRQPEDAPCCDERDPLYHVTCRTPILNTSHRNVTSAGTYEVIGTVSVHPMYRGADKYLARPGKKRDNLSGPIFKIQVLREKRQEQFDAQLHMELWVLCLILRERDVSQ
jgi:hypothetical protein